MTAKNNNNGNGYGNSNGKGKGKYRGPSLRSRMTAKSKGKGNGNVNGNGNSNSNGRGNGGAVREGCLAEFGYVYILANGYKKIYIGMTTQLMARVRQHKNHVNPECHTARYNIVQLVYFETFARITAAIAREKELKGWLRVRKLELIVSTNPKWKTSAPTGESLSSHFLSRLWA